MRAYLCNFVLNPITLTLSTIFTVKIEFSPRGAYNPVYPYHHFAPRRGHLRWAIIVVTVDILPARRHHHRTIGNRCTLSGGWVTFPNDLIPVVIHRRAPTGVGSGQGRGISETHRKSGGRRRGLLRLVDRFPAAKYGQREDVLEEIYFPFLLFGTLFNFDGGHYTAMVN